MKFDRLTHIAGLLAAIVFVTLNFLFAELSHRMSVDRHAVQLPTTSQTRIPSATALRAGFLNFETLAADIAWIWSLVYYGEHRGQNARPAYLQHSAETVTALDPDLRAVYKWFSSSYIQATYPPTYEDIQRVNHFLEGGMERFPTDYRLPYNAGLNYIGYGKFRTDEERIRELTHAIEYLQRASRLEGAPATLPLTVSWMYQRRRQLRARVDGRADETSERRASHQQVEFLAEMYYLVDDPNVRRSIERILETNPRGKELLSQYNRQYTETLQRRRRRSFSYLPLPLWSAVASPDS